MKVLELFAGTRSIGKAFEQRGHEVFSVEWSKEFENIDLYEDISRVTAEDILKLFGKPDVIWASPDCATFSIAAISHHRKKNPETGSLEPVSAYAKFCDRVDKHVLELIEQLQPKYYFIENPRGGMRKMEWMKNLPRYTVTYCQYGDNCINVMEIRRVDRSVNEILDGPGIQLSELAAKIQQLHIFFSLLIPDISHEERQLLDEALVRTYNTKGITHDNASLEDPAQPGQYREMPVLGDLYEILKTSKETMRMAHILNRLVNGSASTFNKQTNVRLDNKYTVLDISSLTGDLLTVGMFVALDFVWDRAKADRTEEKAIFIDECWQLLSGAGAAGVRLAGDFLLEIAKTIRGYGGASIFC